MQTSVWNEHVHIYLKLYSSKAEYGKKQEGVSQVLHKSNFNVYTDPKQTK